MVHATCDTCSAPLEVNRRALRGLGLSQKPRAYFMVERGLHFWIPHGQLEIFLILEGMANPYYNSY
jgi:hypothetical protein